MARRRVRKSQEAGHSKARALDKRDSKMKAWNTVDDIPLDEEDQFHASRDKILLEGDEEGEDEDGDDDEVFALNGLAHYSEEEDEQDESEGGMDVDQNNLSGSSTAKSKKVKRSLHALSDEEEGEEEDEEEGWGNKKSVYYSSNADQIDSDDDEANEMEEKEAIRLQAKMREGLREEDFGLVDSLPIVVHDEEPSFMDGVSATEPLVPVAQDRASALQFLAKTSPETLALAAEWDDTARSTMTFRAKLEQASTAGSPDGVLEILHLYHHIQLTYTAVLAFYLHMRASRKYASRPELLKSHPIMKRLLTLKQSLATLEDLGIGSDPDDDVDEQEDDDALDFEVDGMDLDDETLAGLSRDDFEELLRGLGAKWRAGKALPSPSSPTSKPTKKKRERVPRPVFDLAEPEYRPTRTNKQGTDTSADQFGEPTALNIVDSADKAARRKSLRFYTSKINTASARRENARAALGGDDDIPYEPRKKELEAKVTKRKDLGSGGEDLEVESGSASSKKRGRQEETDSDCSDADDDGYYSLVKKQKSERKAAKAAEYEAERQASRAVYLEEQEDPIGQRGISRAILKNKGLTPHRSKSVRNPRVKKRQRFEKAKKKISSQKAVYKGGISDTGKYDGERSGISKVVKSVKL